MIFQLDKILQDVRICIDENADTESLLGDGDVDTLSLEDIIRSKVLQAVEQVHKVAPYHLIEQGHNFGDAVYWRDMESGYVLLPDDFMRLVVFEMDDWERPVFDAIGTDHPLYARQRSRIKALRGTAQRPVCALSVRGEGRVLEFYSCKSTEAQVSRAVYIPYPSIDSEGGVDISERCYNAVIYTIAGLVLLSYGEAERANAISQLALNNLK